MLGEVLTAIVTPFRADGSVDLDAFRSLAGFLLENGSDGVVVAGTTGEAPTLTDDERLHLVAAAVETVGDRGTVVAGTGTYSTAHSIHLTERAHELGVDGFLVVTPYYNKPPQEGLAAHFTAVADASALPVMLYDIPARTGTAIATETLLRLAEHPRIVANKDAKGDLFATQQVLAASDLAYYSGDDALNLPLLSVGAVGAVSVVGHLVADRIRSMVEAYEAGDVARARDLNSALVPVVVGIMTRTQGAVAVKAALDELGRAGGGALRLPLQAMPPADRAVLRDDLRRGGLELSA